jgi:hypothetical protein
MKARHFPIPMQLPPVPPPNGPIRPDAFRCECVCVEVSKVLDARKQIDCDTFFRLEEFSDEAPTLPLVDIDQNPIAGVDWQPTDDIVCVGAVFKQNHQEHIFVIEKPPADFTVNPIGGVPPAAEITVTVTPGNDPTPSIGDCLVRNTVLVQLQNNTPNRTPVTGYLEVCPVQFIKSLVLFFPDQDLVGQVSVKTESAWEILDCTVDVFLDVLRVSVVVGAHVIVKTWADVQLVTTAYGECDWELLPPPFAESPCVEFVNRPFPSFNPPQLQDFFIPPPPVDNLAKK